MCLSRFMLSTFGHISVREGRAALCVGVSPESHGIQHCLWIRGVIQYRELYTEAGRKLCSESL